MQKNYAIHKEHMRHRLLSAHKILCYIAKNKNNQQIKQHQGTINCYILTSSKQEPKPMQAA